MGLKMAVDTGTGITCEDGYFVVEEVYLRKNEPAQALVNVYKDKSASDAEPRKAPIEKNAIIFTFAYENNGVDPYKQAYEVLKLHPRLAGAVDVLEEENG